MPHKIDIFNCRSNKARWDGMNYPAWLNPYSNTVFFKRPGKWIMDKWDLDPAEDSRLGDPLAHEIIMQHETRETIDRFIEDLKKDVAGQKGGNPG